MAARLVQQHDLSAAAFDQGAVGAAITISTVSVGAAANSAIMSTDSNAGADVWFSSDAAGTLPLAAKLVYWSDGDSEFKFKVYFGSVSAVSGATVYLHVGSKPVGISTDPFDANTIGRWEQSTNFEDSTSNGNDGTPVGSPSAGGVTGPDGVLPATDFNGSSQYINIGDITDTDGATSLTIEGWFNFDIALPINSSLVRKWAAGQQAFALDSGSADDKELRLLIGDNSDILNVKTTDDVLSTGSWQHLAAVWSGGTSVAIYVDGAAVSTTTDNSAAIAALPNVSEPLSLMARNNAGVPDSFVDGKSAGISISTDARTASEINTDYLLDGPNAATYWTVTDVTPSTSGTLGRLKYFIGMGRAFKAINNHR